MKAGIAAALAAAALATLVAAPPASAAPKTELTPETIDDFAEQALDTTGVPGMSVVVTHDDEIVHAEGYGHDSNGDPVTADTPMRVASVTKSFTAMGVMTLVEDGRIDLDEPVADQLPGFEMADPRADEVTVRHLLNQTSGFADMTIDVVDQEKADSLADYVARLKDGGLADDPGTVYRYCNVNYDVAAALVEHVSGIEYGDYMRAKVLKPLGMNDSALRDEDVQPADGYNSLYGAWIPRTEPGFLRDSGAGGLNTTAADMGKWLISQQGQGKQLLSKEGLSESHKPSKADDYAMGWGVDGDRLAHSGNLMTYNAYEAIDTRSGYGVATMTNGSGLVDSGYSVAYGLLEMSEGKKPGDIESDHVFQLVLAAVALLALGLGVLGVLRAKRWAGRRKGRPAWRLVLRLLPLLVPIAVFAFYVDLIELLLAGRTATWEQMTFFPIPLTVTVAIAALAAAATIATRLVRMRTAS